ncbi:hypothetical protein FS749_004735 [Ceratobasidium sp. UAMH 11750]|nr:hypothetical protein FS749_004735 [Ceratobasidium sp. UAMH 11750]
MCYDLHDRVDGLTDNFTQSRIERGEDAYDYVAQQSDLSDVEREENQAGEEDLQEDGKNFRNRCLDIICPT